MRIVEIEKRTSILIKQLLKIWESSVRETHLFLSDNEIKRIADYVPLALNNINHLVIVEDDNYQPVAFMGIEKERLEMLFVAPHEMKKGLGKSLIQFGIKNYQLKELTVNEQNPQAKGFYEHLGFHVYKRTETDEQGNPYPLLYMKLD
ncbi:TPA: GNAT family N-acetyltransferase [Candidatus Gastranaerophilales bacterium HUM_3]|jgi:putative acetyltransferase|nr:MAG TPA: GNAT family N-acetyltransferase [Candidatus Gastranaerophilales bacterium HUM_3]DAB04990.1 MAG TPA: GNAT family N-acetyltransferase [Candidatus Gastranaerophilales bacterium HUM_13]